MLHQPVHAWSQEAPRRTSVMPRLGPRTEERVTLPACRGTLIREALWGCCDNSSFLQRARTRGALVHV